MFNLFRKLDHDYEKKIVDNLLHSAYQIKGVSMMTTDSEQLSQLFHQYFPVIRKIQNKYHVKDFDKDDWSQEGYISLYKATLAYDPAMGASFGSFFKRTFENNIKSQLRKQNAYKRQADVHTTSWEEHTYDATSEFSSLYRPPSTDESLKRLVVIEALLEYISTSSILKQQILINLLKGKEITEISEILELPKRVVQYQLNKIKTQLNHLLY